MAPWHVVCNFTSEGDVGGPLDVYVGVSDGSQKSGSLLFRASACSRSICRSAASSASRVSASTALVSKSNLRFVPRAASTSCLQYLARRRGYRRNKEGDAPSEESVWPEDVETIDVAASPSWPFSNSCNTRSLAASRARCRSSSASFFKASRRTFCLLMSPTCATAPPKSPSYQFCILFAAQTGYQSAYSHSGLKVKRDRTHLGPSGRTPCKTDGPSGTLRGRARAAGRAYTRRTSASTRSLDVAARLAHL